MLSGMDGAQKVRENRIRNAARRQGLTLARSRTRDPRGLDYGTYRLGDATGEPVLKPCDGEDYSGEREQGRPSRRALIQRGDRERLTLTEAAAALKAAPRR
jgi:hypothetical protein